MWTGWPTRAGAPARRSRQWAERCAAIWQLARTLALAALASLASEDAGAMCNVIPAATKDFRAALGSVNRPFAGPGDYVEVRARPALCDRSSTAFVDVDGDGSTADDHVVTVLFVPPNGVANASVLAESCSGINLAACNAQLGGGSAECIEVNGAGEPVGLLGSGPNELQFRFPDTDARVDQLDDDRTLAGPAKLVVTRRGAPLRCEVATTRCAELGGTTQSNGVVACVDELFELDGTCRTQPANLDPTFAGFTALPPPNDIEAVIESPATAEIRFTTDVAGHVLAAMDYSGLLLRFNSVPIPLLARVGTAVEPFTGSGGYVAIPGNGFVHSYSPEGVILPPILAPLSDPSDPEGATLFGSVDAPRGVIRVARQGCVGGDDEGRACTSGAECSSAVCSAAVFEFRDRYFSGVGPVLLVGGLGDFHAELGTPVPLEGLLESEQAFAFVLSEGLDGVDRNADGDVSDFVATLRDRQTGLLQPIGAGGAEGRAVVRVRQPPFAFPAVETEGDLLAFLESEPNEGDQDVNANGQVFDSILRVFRLGATSASEITDPLDPLTADAVLRVNKRSLAFAAPDRLVFLTPEAREASQITSLESVSSLGVQGNFASAVEVSISTDGRFVAFSSIATNLVPGDTNATQDVFVHDRQTGQTTRVSVDSLGAQGDSQSLQSSISADGRFVAFRSSATNLVPSDTNATSDVFVHDRQTGQTTRVSVDSLGAQGNLDSVAAAISADGRFVSFESDASNLVAGDTGNITDVFVHDRASGQTTRVSVDSLGAQGSDVSWWPSISADGRFVAFASSATNLVPGDTNGVTDIFVHDRQTGQTTRVSVNSHGFQGDLASTGPVSFSTAGRYVAFGSRATNLVAGDTNGAQDVFVHDRQTGQTTRVSVDSLGAEGNSQSYESSISADGRFVVFASDANLVPGDMNGARDVVVRGVDTTHLAADRTGDGVLDDTVLRVLDTTVGPPGSVTDLCPAETVAVAGGRAAFLRPEAAGATSNAACTGADLTGPDLNGDADALDAVVHLYDGTAVQNLRCAASDVALSATRLAALVSEADQGAGSLNGDADADDRVLHVRSATAGAPPSCASASWLNVGEAGDALAVSGDSVALLTAEADQHATDLNGDGDALDRVLRLVDGATGTLVPIVDDQLQPDTPQAAEGFVLGPTLLAFHTAEAAQGGQDLNGDGDASDAVLQLYELASGKRINTGQAVLPCRLVACDPRRPYRVSRDTVRFLTLEADQGEDLNDDGDQGDLLIQVFNVISRESRVVGELLDTGASVDDPVTSLDPLAAPQSPEGGEAGGEQIFVSSGRCVEDTALACTVDPDSCAAGEFCFVDPVTATASCVRDTGETCFLDKPPGEQGCPPAATCVEDVVLIAVADADGDEVADALDNCPQTPNVDQADADADGVGDACDLQTCGNGTPELDEECDDGNLVDGDGCDANCRLTGCGNGILTTGEACDDGNLLPGDGCDAACQIETSCGDTLDNDGDGLADYPDDPGCDDPADDSERSSALPCDDGVDNDGDGYTDFDPQTYAQPGDESTDPAGLGDPVCQSPTFARENSQCQDGVDNEGDGRMDYDGGRSIHGTAQTAADPHCTGLEWRNTETRRRCGLGYELTGLLVPLTWLQRRRARKR